MSHERILGVNLFPDKLWACNDSNKIIIYSNKICNSYRGEVFLHGNLPRSPKSFSEIPTFSGDLDLCWDSQSGEAGTQGGKASRLVAKHLETSPLYCGHCFLEYKHLTFYIKHLSVMLSASTYRKLCERTFARKKVTQISEFSSGRKKIFMKRSIQSTVNILPFHIT